MEKKVCAKGQSIGSRGYILTFNIRHILFAKHSTYNVTVFAIMPILRLHIRRLIIIQEIISSTQIKHLFSLFAKTSKIKKLTLRYLDDTAHQ